MDERRVLKRGIGLLALALCCVGGLATAGELARLGHSIFQGVIHEREELGAVAVVGRLLVIGADEGTMIQVLLPGEENNVYMAIHEPISLADGSGEIDIEGIAADGTTVYVLGSHSLKRRKPTKGKSYEENLKRISTVLIEDNRNLLFRLSLDPETGKLASDIEEVGLRALMENDPVLSPFARIPSKENGIDIEGIASDGERLYLGFRSPVLRGDYVPVLVLPYEKPDAYELRFVDLHGKGIRDMARVPGGFLILAGPSDDGGGTYRVYFWDGRDQIPGKDRVKRKVKRLGWLPEARGGSPEGMAVLTRLEYGYEVLILRDGRPNGSPTRHLVPRP